jgi:adenylate cyclase
VALSREVQDGIDGVLAPDWVERTGRVVPEAEDITLRDGAVRLKATYLYADMADSTGLAQSYYDWAVAKVIRCYLNAATRLIRARGGAIRSFDGDRVMGIFVGPNADDLAVQAAIGIDSGEALLVRGGVFGDNDLISIGSAPNIAAKLSEERVYQKYLFVSETVHNSLIDATRYAEGVNVWQQMGVKSYGGKYIRTYASNYWWEP